jgi:molybdopterin synthase sulfur carrier subunit
MTGADQQETMELELRFFATFRAAVGQKTVNWEVDDESTIGDVLRTIEEEYPELVGELLDEDGDIQPQLTVLKNGREVVHLEGTETELDDGDRVSVFPPVAGG